MKKIPIQNLVSLYAFASPTLHKYYYINYYENYRVLISYLAPTRNDIDYSILPPELAYCSLNPCLCSWDIQELAKIFSLNSAQIYWLLQSLIAGNTNYEYLITYR